jgi:rSAM/selenodomain-associated transferase 2
MENTKSSSISVIIPVLHEAEGINTLIDHVKTLENVGPVEIIVADGAEETDTLVALTHPDVVQVKASKGRALQMNAGADKATGDILLFLHADTRLPGSGLLRVAAAMEDTNTQGWPKAGAFSLAIDSNKPFFRLVERMANVRTRMLVMPFGDQALFFQREYFNLLGGFAEIPLMEDVEIMRRIRKRGEPLYIIGLPALTSARRWETEGPLCCWLRNLWLQLCFFLGTRPEKLARQYRPQRHVP